MSHYLSVIFEVPLFNLSIYTRVPAFSERKLTTQKKVLISTDQKHRGQGNPNTY